MRYPAFILLAAFAAGMAPSCNTATADHKHHADTTAVKAPVGEDGTREMVELLAQLAKISDEPMRDIYANNAQADFLLKARGQVTDPRQRIQLEVRLMSQLLYAGRTREAIDMAEEFSARMDREQVNLDPVSRRKLLNLIGMCYMRLGEQTNCQNNHNDESCILPLSEKARHQDPQGSQIAIAVFERTLAEFPDDLNSRWLLNVAHMTLGSWPQGVPEKWLIPEKAFASDVPFPRFHDIAMNVGVAMDGLSGGVCMEDFNGDGLLDLLCSSWSVKDQVRLYINTGEGAFAERTQEAGLTGITGALNMVHADYDNDGDVDVLMLRGAWRLPGTQPNSLLRNKGDGSFEDVTRAAGIFSLHPTQAGAWGDMDNDGDLDLFIGNEHAADNVHPSELYRNNGNGTFTNIAAQAGMEMMAFVKGAAWGDVDNDGRIDLYVSDLRGPNRLYMNKGVGANGIPTFLENGANAGVTEPRSSFPAWIFDYDNDGWLDIFCASFPITDHYGEAGALYAAKVLGLPYDGDTPHLYRNKGDGTFEDVTVKAHLDEPLYVMGSNFGDLDNDGFEDIYLGTGEPELRSVVPNRMFLNDGKGGYLDVTTAGGFGHLQKGHGVAFGDLDNDGDQDVYEVMGGAFEGDNFTNVLYENPGMGKHWVKLQLQGVKANRCAIGARVAVTVKTAKGARTFHRMIGTGSSFGSDPLRAEIGLADAQAIESVTVIWPGTGTVQTWSGLSMDTAYRLVEGEEAASTIALPRMVFQKAAAEGHHHHGM